MFHKTNPCSGIGGKFFGGRFFMCMYGEKIVLFDKKDMSYEAYDFYSSSDFIFTRDGNGFYKCYWGTVSLDNFVCSFEDLQDLLFFLEI